MMQGLAKQGSSQQAQVTAMNNQARVPSPFAQMQASTIHPRNTQLTGHRETSPVLELHFCHLPDWNTTCEQSTLLVTVGYLAQR